MSIFVIGINHKTAPLAVREQLYFAADKLGLYLQDVLQRRVATQAVLLSTCNRSELYCETNNINLIREWFCSQTTLQSSHVEPMLYIYKEEEAVAHIMQVACGLDSMVLGEPQILGQMKEAFSESCAVGAVDTLFYRLFQTIFSVAKEIRSVTEVGACPVSVASAAIHFAKQQLPDITKANVVLIGAGSTTELLTRYLAPQLKNPLTIVNRSLENAAVLAETFNCKVVGFDKLAETLAIADLAFSATGSALPIVTKPMLADALEQSKRDTQTVLIDIAVPRDIEPAVGELPNIKLFCIDDLKSIIEKHRQGREHAAEKARAMIQEKSAAFIAEMQSFDHVSHTIRAYRSQIEDICQAELLKAKQQLHIGMDPAQVLETFAHLYTNKLLHTPSVQLRQAGVEGRFELLRLAKQLFAISDPEVEWL